MADLPAILSPSAAGTYRQCPRRWKHRYVDKLPDPPGEAALVGTFAHRVLELLCDEPPDQRTADRARALAREVWPQISAHPDYRGLGLADDAQREFRWKSWQAIEGLWQLEDPAGIDVRATEQRLSTVVAGVPFRGVVDRLDDDGDTLVVTDYKSGRPPRAADRQKSLDQVLLYAAAVEAETGERPGRARLLYLGREIIETTVDDGALDGATGRLAGTWSDLGGDCAGDTFATSPGPLCGWCPYAGICSDGQAEIKRRLAAGRMRTDAPALALI